MKLTIVYDNEAYKAGLKADWGFACVIEAYGKRILFDTGANGMILLDNMQQLGIDPKTIREVFISHGHWDHTGGLAEFLKVNDEVKLYVPTSWTPPIGVKDVIKVDKPLQLHENIFSTGTVKGVEQSLVIKLDKGVAIVVGCSHSGVNNILGVASEFGKPSAIIGGLHGFNEFELIKELELICPTHCTQFKSRIKSLYPDKYVEGGVGKIIEL